MSGVPRENGLGMEEKEPVVLLQENTSFDDDDEEVAVIQQTAAEFFEKVHPHRWPVPGSFSFGGILEGVSSGGGAGGFGGKGSETSGPWWQSLGSVPTARRMWMVIAGVVMAIFVAVAVTGGGAGGLEDQEGDESPLSAGMSRSPGEAMAGKRGGSFDEPSPLRSRLHAVADAALSGGVTMPIHTTFEIVRASDREGEKEGEKEGGMDFIVSVIATKALEAKAAVASPPSTAASTDPFDARVLDPRMIVEELPPAHSLVLNKFNSVRNHALIITKEFQSQEEALTEADFSACYHVVEQLPAVGFYNSAVEAGASQRHKHMQVIPEDALWEYRPQATEAIPVDEPISRLVGSSRDFSRVWRVPGFDFQHALTLIPSIDELSAVAISKATGVRGAEDGLRKMAAHLRDRYVTLLGEVGFDTSSLLQQGQTDVPPSGENASAEPSAGVPPSSLPPYNALLTSRWLMVVPRSKREWEGIDVNGMGFFGALLVREKAFLGEGAGVEAVRGPGALAVLEGVTFQSKSS